MAPSRLGIGGWDASFVLTQLALRRRSTYLRRGKRFFFINARREKRCAIPGKQHRAFAFTSTVNNIRLTNIHGPPTPVPLNIDEDMVLGLQDG